MDNLRYGIGTPIWEDIMSMLHTPSEYTSRIEMLTWGDSGIPIEDIHYLSMDIHPRRSQFRYISHAIEHKYQVTVKIREVKVGNYYLVIIW